MSEDSNVAKIGEVIAAARRHGLTVRAEGARLDTSGLDFLAVHASDADGVAWILREPRRAEVFTASAIEARVLRKIRSRLPVAVPNWEVHAAELIAYRRLAGTPAVTVTEAGPQWHVVSQESQPAAFVDSHARTIAALQAISLEGEAPVRTISEVRASLAATLEATRAALQPEDKVWARWQRWLANDAVWPRHTALVHGDLHPGHMLLDAEGRMTGVLDWSEACVTDPSIDVALFLGCFGRAATAAMIAAFEQAGGVTWPGMLEHAAERSAVFPALGAEWALRTDNAAVLEFARGGLATVTAETQ